MPETKESKYEYLPTRQPIVVRFGNESLKISEDKSKNKETGKVFHAIRIEKAFGRYNNCLTLPIEFSEVDLDALLEALASFKNDQ